MLYRKIKLSTFGLYLKAVSKLWLVPLLTVNVLVPGRSDPEPGQYGEELCSS